MNITIIGAGSFGTALGKILDKNNHSVTYYDPKKFPHISLETSLKDAKIIVFAAPSQTALRTLSRLPSFARSLPFILTSKGFWDDTPFIEVFGNNFSILSGPSFADDLNSCKTTTMTTTSALARNLFRTSWLSFDKSRDKKGILICGSLKNIYAIFAGMINLKRGSKDYRTFINFSLKEMKSILKANSCNPATADLSCGLGDLILTTTSTSSRNYCFGRSLNKISTKNSKSSTVSTPINRILSAQQTSDKNTKKEEQNFTILSPKPLIEGLNALKSLKISKIVIPEDAEILKTVIERTKNEKI